MTITKAPAAQVKTVTYSDIPALDPNFIELHKVPFVQNTIRDDVDGVPVENAYFLLEYFDNHTFTGPATRQWIIKTDENGVALFDEQYIIPSLTVNGTRYTSSDFYIDDDSNGIAIPIGCVKLTEIQSPAGYKKLDTSLQGQINEAWHPRTGKRIASFQWNESKYLETTTDDSTEGGQVKAELGEVQKYGSFVIKKEDKETTRLQGDSTFVGIEYEIQNITKDKNGNPKDIVLESGEKQLKKRKSMISIVSNVTKEPSLCHQRS